MGDESGNESPLSTPDSQSILENLERLNLFLVPLDDQRRWYRYHQLFAELLRHRLARAYPDQIADLHRPICAVMIVIFLIPTFGLHWHWLKVLPTMVPVVKAAIKDDKAQGYLRSFDRQSYHAHEVGLRDNLVFLIAAIYFAIKGSAAYGVDNLLNDWVVRFF